MFNFEFEGWESVPHRFRGLEDKFGINGKAQECKNKNLYLYGQTGAGKTVMAVFVMRILLRESNTEGNKNICKFISYPEFVFTMQSNFENAELWIKKISLYRGCLILDDFGGERLTDFARLVSYLIINHREQYNLQTIITSNYTLNEIDIMIDRRISSRIAGMCGKEGIIELSGDKRLIHTGNQS